MKFKRELFNCKKNDCEFLDNLKSYIEDDEKKDQICPKAKFIITVDYYIYGLEGCKFYKKGFTSRMRKILEEEDKNGI